MTVLFEYSSANELIQDCRCLNILSRGGDGGHGGSKDDGEELHFEVGRLVWFWLGLKVGRLKVKIGGDG